MNDSKNVGNFQSLYKLVMKNVGTKLVSNSTLNFEDVFRGVNFIYSKAVRV